MLFPLEFGQEKAGRLLGYNRSGTMLTPYEEWNFDIKTAQRELNDHFGTATLESFGVTPDSPAVVAAGAIFRYLKENHRDKLAHITRLTLFDNSEYMSLDYSSVRNLELIRNLTNGTEEHSLYSVINLCHTPGGARRLKGSLLRPFKVREKIQRRLSGVT